MSKGRDALVVGAIRSPIGSGRTKDSDFKDLSPQDLALQVLDVSFKRTNMPKEAIQVYRVGSVVSLKSDKFTQAPAREIALRAGMFNASSGISEKACSSGLRAVYEASEAVRHGGVNFAIGAGLDMMSNAPAGANSGALTCPLTKKSMARLASTAMPKRSISPTVSCLRRKDPPISSLLKRPDFIRVSQSFVTCPKTLPKRNRFVV